METLIDFLKEPLVNLGGHIIEQSLSVVIGLYCLSLNVDSDIYYLRDMGEAV